jgi:hypothetical protein
MTVRNLVKRRLIGDGGGWEVVRKAKAEGREERVRRTEAGGFRDMGRRKTKAWDK